MKPTDDTPFPPVHPSSPETTPATPKEGVDRRQFLSGVGGVTVAALAGATIGGAALAGDPVEAVEIAPRLGNQRRNRAFQIRHQAALDQKALGVPSHLTNGDEELFPSRIGNFHKTLPHNAFGEVDPAAYDDLLKGLAAGSFELIEAVPKGGTTNLLNPLGGLAYNIEGSDSAAITVPPPPSIRSAEFAAQMVELYWMALLRDVPFTDYATNPLVQAACDDLSNMTGYTGPRDSGSGLVTPQTLFRIDYPGVLDGPMGSQFLYRAYNFNGIPIDPRIRTNAVGADFLTLPTEFVTAQNGFPGGAPAAAPTDPTLRYPRSVRDLGRIAGTDTIYSQFFSAAIVAGALGTGVADSNPYKTSLRQGGFATFGLAHLTALIGSVHHSERETWYQKWNVHRFPRPEAGSGLVHFTKTGARSYPLHPDVLTISTALPLVFEYNRQRNLTRFGLDEGSYLLPIMFSGGSPSHPSFPAGHAVSAGSCTTILKAWFQGDALWPNPVKPNADGTALVPYVAGVDGPPLTVEGEINKLCHNLSFGRDMSGVHWRADNTSGNSQGEEVAVRLLREQGPTYPEPFTGYEFNRFDGTAVKA